MLIVRIHLLLVLINNIESVIVGDLNMIIGVIGRAKDNSTFDLTSISVSRYNYNITVLWRGVDVREIYQIFRSVKALDEDPTVQLIVLLDYDPSFPNLDHIVETHNKPLMKWGDRRKLDFSPSNTPTEDISKVSSTELCGDALDDTLMGNDPYCLTDFNTTGAYTLPDKSLTVTAPAAMLKLVKRLAWRTVILVHDNSTEWETMEMMHLLSKNRVLFAIYNIDRMKDISNFLSNVYNKTVRTSAEVDFVVLGRFYTARRLFRSANSFDNRNNYKTSLRSISRWLVAVYGHTYGVSRALQACADDLDNVVIVAFPEFHGTATELEFARVLEDVLYETHRENLDITTKNISFSNTIRKKLNEKSSTWNPLHKCKGFKIDTLLWTLSGRSFSTVGHVTLNGDVVMSSDLFPNTKYGFNKRKFTVSTLSYKPFVEKKVYENGTVSYQGFCMDLLNELARTLNFSYELIEPKDQKWGALEGNNYTFNGLVGQVQRLECDMVVAPLSIQPNRAKFVDFSYPFYYDYTTAVVKKPDPIKTKWRTLVDPFKWEVLLCIGIALPLMTFLAFLIEKYNPYYQTMEQAELREQTGGLHTFHDAFWYMYGALLCQGGVHLPDTWAGRTFVSCWWLFCIVVVAIYCGNLIAFLTVTKDKPPFNSLEELLMLKGEFRWGTLGGTAWEDILIRVVFTCQILGPGGHFLALGGCFIFLLWKFDSFSNSQQRMQSVKNSKTSVKAWSNLIAWIGDKTTIELEMAEECGLMTIKEEFLPLKYALVFPKHSTHLSTFSNQMISIHESGLLQIWKRRWWPKSNFCSGNIVTEAKPIAIVDVQSAYYVCVLGILIGTTAFVCELIVFHCSKNKGLQSKLESINYKMTGSVRFGASVNGPIETEGEDLTSSATRNGSAKNGTNLQNLDRQTREKLY